MLIEAFVHDVRYALRGLRRSPLFTASVAGTMGIGLGVLCSVFTIVNAYLFKSVNLPEAHDLYGLSWDSEAHQRHGFSLDDFEALAEQNPVFAHVAATTGVAATLNGLPLLGQVVTEDYFTVLGGSAAMGRTIGRGDFATPGEASVIVLSHDGWRMHFGSDPKVVGKAITLTGRRFVIIGVARAGATLRGSERTTFWAPLTATAVFAPTDPERREARDLSVVGRRRATVTAARVGAWFDTWVHHRFRAESDLAPTRVRVEGLAARIPLNRGTRTLFSLLTAAFGLVLLVASANVTNMLLARGLGRQREFGVRLSLGASRSRVVGQLMVESLVLSLPAAGVGLALTILTARLFPWLVRTTLPAGTQELALVLMPFDPDVRVLAALTGVAVLAALLVGLSPALQLTKPNLVDAVRGQLGPNTRVSRTRNAFVVLQIAACVLFLVVAVGLVAEASRMASDETGLDYERILDLQADAGVLPSVAAALAAHGDVEQVAAAGRPPLVSPMWLMRVTPLPGREQRSAGFMTVSPEYFAALGVQLRSGRVFSAAEAEQNVGVVVVSEATARAFWPGRDPLGQSLEIAPPIRGATTPHPTHARVTVIGVAEDVVNGTLLDGVARTTVYFPTTAASPDTRLLVRTRSDPAVALRSVALALEAAFPTVSFRIAPLRQHAAVQVWAFRAFSTAALIPAVIGLLLAFAGTYGVVAFIMVQRTREFGIRMALGASAGRIIRSVVGHTVSTALIAAAVGLATTVVVIRGAGALLHVVPVIDVRIYAAGVAVVVVASALASLIPALRAIRLDPSAALRTE